MLPVFLLGHVKSVCLLINYLPLSGYLMVQKHKVIIYKESYIYIYSKKKKGSWGTLYKNALFTTSFRELAPYMSEGIRDFTLKPSGPCRQSELIPVLFTL